ncbi:phage integrase SAM-like domain-containing protein [Wenyingzhuangia sp. IMCC45533]
MPKVKLRHKPLKNGKSGLYLDYTINGKRTKEYLKLHVIDKPKKPLEKIDKKNTLNIAEQLRSKRENELLKPEVYNEFEKERIEKTKKGEKCFIQYYHELSEKREGSNYGNWLATIYYLKHYFGNSISFKNLNVALCEGYKEYLLSAKSKNNSNKEISINTASSYFNKFKHVLKQAYKEDILEKDLNKKITGIKEEEVIKEFLTLNEVNNLIENESIEPDIKRMCLISVLTGVRYVDMNSMKWEHLKYNKDTDVHSLQFIQDKTGVPLEIPISKQCLTLLGKPKEPNDLIFEGKIKYSNHLNEKIQRWVNSSGINKKITYHCFRHTYAVLQLSNGTGIFTVMKMMGHTSINTTLRYAKLVDEKKVETTNKIILSI